MSPTSTIYGLEAKSKQCCNRCNVARLEQNIWFCIPTLQLDRSGNKQGSSGKCRSNDNTDTTTDTTMVYSSWYTLLLRMSIQRPLLLPVLPNEPITKSPGRRTYSCKSQVPKVNGAENYRNTLEIEGISSSAAKLISMSRRPGSTADYESAWNKWVSWCCRQQIDPVSAPLSGILNYLSTLFEKGLQYRTINSHRSAISAYHDHVDGKPVGKHLRVSPLLTGVFNQRPPQPRYTFVWDVEIVFVYLKTNMSDNS